MEVIGLERKARAKMAIDLLKDVDAFLGGFELGSHVGITDLQRKTDWRQGFAASKMVEVLDRNQPFAVMLKPELFDAVRKYIAVLERQLEELQIEALFTQRSEERMNWTTGDDLKQKAKESFRDRKELIRGLLDGDQ